MNWDAIGAIAELAGAGGVIVTLTYLAVQLRQNSTLLSASMANAHREAANELTILLASDKSAASVFWEGLANRAALSDEDRQQFDAQLTLWFASVLQSFQASDDTALDRFEWGFDYPGVHEWWARYATTFTEPFQKEMNRRLATYTVAAQQGAAPDPS